MQHLLNIYLDPAKVFAELKAKPWFWLPLLLLIVANMAMVLGYFSSVDADWFADHQLMQSGKEMSTAEIAQAKQFMPSARTMGYIGVATSPILMAIFMSIYALYYMLAGRITGHATGFKQGFTLGVWSSMPALLGTLVGLVGVLTMTPQTALESLMLTHLDPLVVQLPMDSVWSTFAKSFDLLMLWSMALAALGWRIWNRSSWNQAAMVAVFPAVLIYGTWALIVSLK